MPIHIGPCPNRVAAAVPLTPVQQVLSKVQKSMGNKIQWLGGAWKGRAKQGLFQVNLNPRAVPPDHPFSPFTFSTGIPVTSPYHFAEQQQEHSQPSSSIYSQQPLSSSQLPGHRHRHCRLSPPAATPAPQQLQDPRPRRPRPTRGRARGPSAGDSRLLQLDQVGVLDIYTKVGNLLWRGDHSRPIKQDSAYQTSRKPEHYKTRTIRTVQPYRYTSRLHAATHYHYIATTITGVGLKFHLFHAASNRTPFCKASPHSRHRTTRTRPWIRLKRIESFGVCPNSLRATTSRTSFAANMTMNGANNWQLSRTPSSKCGKK